MTGKTTDMKGVKLSLFAALVGLGYLCRQHQDNDWLRLLGTCLSLYAFTKILLLLAKGVKAARHLARHGGRAEEADLLIKRSMPGWIVGYYEVEKRIYRSFFDALRFAPARKVGAERAEAAGADGTFGVDAAPRGILRILPLALLAILGLSFWGAAQYFALGVWWQLGLAALCVYAAVWVVGDSKAGYHPDVVRFGYEVPSKYTSLTLSLRDAQLFMGIARPRMQ